MSTYKAKVVGWDDETKSLIVKFASSATASSNPDDYEAAAIQPFMSWGGITSEESIKRELGLHAKANADFVASIENVSGGEAALIDMYKSWVGSTFEFSDVDLAPTTDALQANEVEL